MAKLLSRPRLDPADPEPVPTDPLDALSTLFDTLHRECMAALRGESLAGLVPFGAGDLDWLNGELEGIRRLNRALPPAGRSRAVAAWPTPVLAGKPLIGPDDVLVALDLAQAVLARARPCVSGLAEPGAAGATHISPEVAA